MKHLIAGEAGFRSAIRQQWILVDILQQNTIFVCRDTQTIMIAILASANKLMRQNK